MRRWPSAEIIRTVERFDERTDLLIFRSVVDPGELLGLRTVEDVFVLAAEHNAIPTGRAGLAAIRGVVAGAPGLENAISIALRVRPRRKGKPTFRVIARLAGEHAFRRVDLERATELGILGHFPGWRLVEDDAQLEVWAQLVRSWLIVGIRLSDGRMRQREYRRASLPASLKPTIAAAMTQLSCPEEDDVFLDPMCGSGTILIERALAGHYRQLLGGDIDPAAISATRENIGPRYKPIEITQWDASALPLDDDAVSVIVSNLPFGKQIGSQQENRTLYPALITEWNRVLRPNGRMVLLTSERDLLRRAVAQHAKLRMEREIRVLVRGMRAAIYLIHK